MLSSLPRTHYQYSRRAQYSIERGWPLQSICTAPPPPHHYSEPSVHYCLYTSIIDIFCMQCTVVDTDRTINRQCSRPAVSKVLDKENKLYNRSD